MSINQAAIHYNLPYSSLYGRFKRGKYEEPVVGDISQDGSNQADGPAEYLGWQKPWDKGFVRALIAESGKEKWKASRGLMTRIAHATPMVIDTNGQTP